MNIRDHFGLDIGTQEIKAVWLSEDNGVVKLLSFGVAKTPEGVNLWENSEGQRLLAEAVQKLTQDCHIEARDVVVSIPESQIITRVIETPVLPDDELESAIKWEAEQYVPVPLDQVFLRFQVLSAPPEGKMDVLLVAAPNTIVNGYLSVLKMAGLTAVGIETEILAISRSLVVNDPYSPTTLIVNLGASTTDLSVVKKGNISFVRSISTGSEAVTRSISAGLGLDVSQAEEYKKTYGLDASKLEGKIAGVIKPVMEGVVAEIKKAIVYYQSKQPGEQVKRVTLSGGMALMPGLINFLGEELTLEVQIGNPLTNIAKTEQQTQALADAAPLYAASVGLALKKI